MRTMVNSGIGINPEDSGWRVYLAIPETLNFGRLLWKTVKRGYGSAALPAFLGIWPD